MASTPVRLLRHPLLHFIVVGGALALVASRLGTDTAPEPIVIGPTELETIRVDWLARHGDAPSAAEWRAAVREAVDEEVLVREALALDFHRSDPLVRRRLLRDLAFLGDEEGDEDERVERALALGLARSDLVVRRRLVQRMEAVLSAAAREEPVSPEAVATRYAEEVEAGLHLRPARWRLTQLFLGDADERTVARSLARARALGLEGAVALSRPLLVPARLGPASAAALTRRLGAGFGEAVASLPVGRWSGPVASSYGLHLVFVEERLPAAPRPLEEVAGSIERAIREQRAARARREALAALRGRTAVRVAEGGAAGSHRVSRHPRRARRAPGRSIPGLRRARPRRARDRPDTPWPLRGDRRAGRRCDR